jgi:isoquinoline 1-oxidoreductase subunit alpha
VEFHLNVNGESKVVDCESDKPLLWVLRENLQLKGAKFGCGRGLCGACTVHLDGEAVRSCQIPVGNLPTGKLTAKITTIEGLGKDRIGKELQKAWVAHDVPQCGYCQAGQIMSAAALLRKNPKASPHEVDVAMNGNLCRCGTYLRIRAAILHAKNHVAHSKASVKEAEL